MFVVLDKETEKLEFKCEEPEDALKARSDLIKVFVLRQSKGKELSKLTQEVLEEYAMRRWKVYSLEKWVQP